MSRRLKKYTIKEVRKIFKDGGCKLLSKIYKNGKDKLDYICICKKQAKISLFDFKRGRRCKKCAIKRRAEKLKFTYKDVKQYFKDHKCELLETEYKNCDTLLRYRCDCGNTKCKISFYEFKQGHRCRKCMGKRIAEKRRLLFEDVKQYFKDHDCELLATEYKNNYTLMRYICNCGNTKCKISFGNFKKGRRCKICKIKKMSGKNNHSYDPSLTDEEREKGRCCPGLGRWKKDVREKDNHTCQYCRETEGILCAHHIEPYTPNEELRVVVSNGILLCEKHHIEFHKTYGYDCNREQLNEFLKIGVK